jgi:NAD(P)H-quinone oxidoreductase subunit 5
MQRLDPVPGIASFPLPVALAVAGSGVAGVVAGTLVHLDRFWSRSRQKTVRVVQDLLAFDFYTPAIYRATIVAFVAGLANLTNWFDRVVVNGLVNGIGRASLISAEGLKLGVSGQMQTYVLTVLVAIVLLLSAMQWWFS